MTRSELIDLVSAKVDNFTRKDVETIVSTLFSSIAEGLANNEKIEIRGFGSFKVKSRDGRKGRNPKSGDGIFIDSKKVPFFKAGKELKERVDSL